MDIHHLKIFYEACNEKSFTKAAKKLFISQSAVSIQIKKLEDSLNTTLIERKTKHFKLTFAGKELYRLSKDVFNRILRLENEMNKILTTNKLKLIIGATHNIGEPILPKIISEYSKKNENLEFDIYIKNNISLIKLLKDGIIDVAIMEDENIEDRDIKCMQTDHYPFVVIAPSFVNTLKDIKNLTFLKKDTPVILKYIESFENLIKFQFSKKMIVNGSNETIKKLVIDGMGLSVLPYYCVYQEIKLGQMKVIHKFNKLDSKFQIFYLKENENKIWIKDFLNFLKDYDIKSELKDSITKLSK